MAMIINYYKERTTVFPASQVALPLPAQVSTFPTARSVH